MRKDKNLEKLFNLTTWGVKIITLILLIVYLRLHVSTTVIGETFLLFIAPTVFFVIFLLYNGLLVHFYKKGFYKSEQAVEFYTKCRERNISLFKDENIEKAKDVYFSIFDTDAYCGEGLLLAHMEEIYNVGKETTEKQYR